MRLLVVLLPHFFFLVSPLSWGKGAQATEAEDCHAPASAANDAQGLAKTVKMKTCPDFKSDASREFCCPSSVSPGAVYCCTADEVQRLRDEEAARRRREFVKDYLLVIIIATLACVAVLLFASSCVCKRVRHCPLYRPSDLGSGVAAASSMYRPVDTIPPKIYEAPPPYESAFVPPPDCQQRNDWHCLLENEINGARTEP